MRSDEREDKQHFYWIDWLRFIAAFIVVVSHARGGHFLEFGALRPQDQSAWVAIAFAVTRLGGEAVVLFFVLSGYLVGGINAQKAFNGRFNVAAYLIDRLTRIYVPLLPALALSALVGSFFGMAWSPLELLGNVFGLQGTLFKPFAGNMPLWSLAYELWFYLLWAAILTLIARNVPRYGIAPWLVLALSLAIFTKLPQVYLFCWILGAIVYLNSHTFAKRLTGISLSLPLMIVGITLTQLTSATISMKIDWLHTILPSPDVSILILGFAFASFIKTVASWKPRSEFISSFERLGTPFANFSYTMYLAHYPLLAICDALSNGRAAEITVTSVSFFALKVISVVFVSWLFYLPFERNTHKIRRWAKRIVAPVKDMSVPQRIA